MEIERTETKLKTILLKYDKIKKLISETETEKRREIELISKNYDIIINDYNNKLNQIETTLKNNFEVLKNICELKNQKINITYSKEDNFDIIQKLKNYFFGFITQKVVYNIDKVKVKNEIANFIQSKKSDFLTNYKLKYLTTLGINVEYDIKKFTLTTDDKNKIEIKTEFKTIQGLKTK